MDKKFLLAIVSSFMVLYLWSVISPKPPSRSRPSISTQPIENKQDTIISTEFNLPSKSVAVPIGTVKNVLESLNSIESEKFVVEFSNIGGTLKSFLIKEYDMHLPVKNFTNIIGYENIEFNLDKKDQKSIIYSYEDENYKIFKKYTVSKDDYLVYSDIEIQTKKNASRMDDLTISGFTLDMTDLDTDKDMSMTRDRSLFEYLVASNDIFRKGKAFKFSSKENKENAENVQWIAFRERYFCTIVKPQYDSQGYFIRMVDDKHLKIGIESKNIKISQSGNINFSYIIYMGPETTDILKKYNLGFEKIKMFYRFPLFDVMGKIIYYLMHLTYKVFPNWGVCIMLMSTFIYGVTYPLTLKSMTSMKKLQTLQPKVAQLKEKYKDNPQKMNKEMMELYKTEKANPLGGCLPMFLQMPVFIGLYQALWRDVSFKGAHFLWIKDLSAPDRLFTFPFTIPFVGNEFNLLPLIMVVVMFFQQKLSSKNMVAMGPDQMAQQKMMSTIMPIFLGVIFYNFASGLTLYFTMFYFYSTFTQWKMAYKPIKGNS